MNIHLAQLVLVVVQLLLGREPHGTATRGLEQPRRDQLAVQPERLAQPPRLNTRAGPPGAFGRQ